MTVIGNRQWWSLLPQVAFCLTSGVLRLTCHYGVLLSFCIFKESTTIMDQQIINLYNEAAAKLAWKRTLDFFDRHLD